MAAVPRAIVRTVTRTGDVRKVCAWIRDGGDVNSSCGEDYNDVPLLHRATAFGHLGIIKLLLEAGADPNQPGYFYGTALNLACLDNFDFIESPSEIAAALDVARLLLDYGADVDGMSKIDYEHLERGAKEPCAFSPLMRCAYAGYTEPLKLLLSRGANVDLKSDNGLTAEMLASAELSTQEVRSLAARTIPPELRPYGDKAMPHIDADRRIPGDAAFVTLLTDARRARRARHRYQLLSLYELCARGRATPPLWRTIAHLFPPAAYSSRAPEWDRRRARTVAQTRLPKSIFRLILEFY